MYISKIKYKGFNFSDPYSMSKEDDSIRYIDIVGNSLVEFFDRIYVEFDEKEYFYSFFSDPNKRFYFYNNPGIITRDFLYQLRQDYVKISNSLYISKVNRALINEKYEISYFYNEIINNELDGKYIIINNKIVKLNTISCYSNPCEFTNLTERFHILEPIKIFKNKKDAEEFLREMNVSK